MGTFTIRSASTSAHVDLLDPNSRRTTLRGGRAPSFSAATRQSPTPRPSLAAPTQPIARWVHANRRLVKSGAWPAVGCVGGTAATISFSSSVSRKPRVAPPPVPFCARHAEPDSDVAGLNGWLEDLPSANCRRSWGSRATSRSITTRWCPAPHSRGSPGRKGHVHKIKLLKRRAYSSAGVPQLCARILAA